MDPRSSISGRPDRGRPAIPPSSRRYAVLIGLVFAIWGPYQASMGVSAILRHASYAFRGKEGPVSGPEAVIYGVAATLFGLFLIVAGLLLPRLRR